jgi:hypothetical protein
MSPFFLNYLFWLCSAGFVVLLIFSGLAFAGVQTFKIRDKRNISAGISLLLPSMVSLKNIIKKMYLGGAIFLYFRIDKMNKLIEQQKKKEVKSVEYSNNK